MACGRIPGLSFLLCSSRRVSEAPPGFRPNFRPPPPETLVVPLHREAGGSGGKPTPPALAVAPTLGIHQRAPRRQSTKRRSAQPIISAFPFLASPNLALGCWWQPKINQPHVIHRCLPFLSHFHLLFICWLCMMPSHYLLC